MRRNYCLIFVLITCSKLVYADPEKEPVLICDGQYKQAAQMVNDALWEYGTLYSGGNNSFSVGTLRPTINLYGLWRGGSWTLKILNYPVLKWEDELVYHLNGSGYGPIKADVLRNIQWTPENNELAELPAVYCDERGCEDWGLYYREHEDEIRTATILLDLGGAATYPSDVWLDDPRYQNTSTIFLWLQYILTASNTPWSHIPAIASASLDTTEFNGVADVEPIEMNALERLSTLAWEKYQNGQGIEWAVAALLLLPPRIENKEADKLFQSWQDDVFSCNATEAQYAAWAVVAPYKKQAIIKMRDDQLLNFFPESVKTQAFIYAARADLLHLFSYYTNFLYDFYGNSEFIAKNIHDKSLLSWYAAGQSFFYIPDSRKLSGQELEQIIQMHHGVDIDPITADRFNLLTNEDMLTLARQGNFDVDTNCSLISTAYARLVTQGEDQKALALLPELLPLYPETHQQFIMQILNQNLPDQVKNALVVLYTPLISTQISIGHTGHRSWSSNGVDNRQCSKMVGTEYMSDEALKRDLPPAILLGTRFTDNRRQWLMGSFGSDYSFYSRIYRNDFNHSFESTQGRRYPVLPILSQDTFKNISALAPYLPENGLTHVVSVNIIRWIKSSRYARFFQSSQDKKMRAEALRRVIRMNRYNDGGKIDDVPVGQRAHLLLQHYYSQTEAAKQTPYWYIAPAFFYY